MNKIKEQKKLAEEIKANKSKARSAALREPGEYAGQYQYNLIGLKHKYRHHHIAYCLLRGRKYEEIERHCRDDNQPDFDYIDKIKAAYAEEAHEDVRACA